VELSFRIKFSLSRNLSGYEPPAISKQQNVTIHFKDITMKIKLKDFKHKTGKIFAEAIISDKEVIRTISLDDEYIVNGKPPDSDFRTTYELVVLDKFDPNFKYGKLVIKYLIFPGVTYRAFIVANIFKRIYLKLLFKKYSIQKIDGGIRTASELIAFIITTIVTWYASKC
jgi:hypothetical protein